VGEFRRAFTSILFDRRTILSNRVNAHASQNQNRQQNHTALPEEGPPQLGTRLGHVEFLLPDRSGKAARKLSRICKVAAGFERKRRGSYVAGITPGEVLLQTHKKIDEAERRKENSSVP
jgi:hypothetical protein